MSITLLIARTIKLYCKEIVPIDADGRLYDTMVYIIMNEDVRPYQTLESRLMLYEEKDCFN